MTTISAVANRLLHILRDTPGTYSIESLAGSLRASKTKVRQALCELEEANLIRIEEED